MIPLSDRLEAADLIQDAVSKGARKQQACDALNISLRTLERWHTPEKTIKQDARLSHGRAPSFKLTEAERGKVISVAISKEFSDLPPHQIVPTLADQGKYVASESSFYRILNAEKLNKHRSKSKKGSRKKVESHVATKPNELWSWDITYLPTTVKGQYFYLYLIMDVFSRKIVGYEVYENESAEYASMVAKEAYLSEKIDGKTIKLHSDNGSPMKGATMLSMLQTLGVVPSFSRPSVSNDNPYSESLFKTLKYSLRE